MVSNAVVPLDRTLAALADPHRRRSVELLAESPRRAGELASAVGISPAVMSRHLRVLREANMIVEEQPPFDARVRIISLRSEPIQGLASWLAETEAGWSEQLASLKSHIEGS